jgi:hypothetical protein
VISDIIKTLNLTIISALNVLNLSINLVCNTFLGQKCFWKKKEKSFLILYIGKGCRLNSEYMYAKLQKIRGIIAMK